MVCIGNICRSPMAEGFFLHQLKNNQSSVLVTSAGINALINYSADPNAIAVMSKYGIDISTHRARQVNDAMIRKAELILVMTQSHLAAITNQFLVAKGKTFLLGYWHDFEINDPYMQSYETFEKVYEQIELAWQEWKTRILSCQSVSA